MKKLKIILKILFCTVLISILFKKLDFNEFKNLLSSSSPVYFIPAFIFLFCNTLISTVKWRILLRSDGVRIDFPFLLSSYMIGTFMNMFLPSSVGGDVVRVADIARKGKSRTKSFASVFIDRASGFLALAVIGFLSLLFKGHEFLPVRVSLSLTIIFLLIIICFLSLFINKVHDLASKLIALLKVDKISSLFDKLTLSFKAYKGKPSVLIRIIALSLIFQLLVCFIVYLYALALGLEPQFYWFVVIMPVITVIESIPLTPFSIGTRDLGYVFFFTKAGLSMEQSELLALSYLFMAVIYSLSGGVLFVFRKEIQK